MSTTPDYIQVGLCYIKKNIKHQLILSSNITNKYGMYVISLNQDLNAVNSQFDSRPITL